MKMSDPIETEIKEPRENKYKIYCYKCDGEGSLRNAPWDLEH